MVDFLCFALFLLARIILQLLILDAYPGISWKSVTSLYSSNTRNYLHNYVCQCVFVYVIETASGKCLQDLDKCIDVIR